MKKAIITGASGFLGGWLLQELSARGVQTIAVLREEKSCEWVKTHAPGAQTLICPQEQIQTLPDLLPDCDADVLFHLAWEGSTGAERADTTLQLKNVQHTLDTAKAAASLGCRRFVGAGTLAELDCNSYIPLDGSSPNPVSCYGTAKITAHYMSKAVCGQLGIDHLWACISNTYGAGNKTQNFVNFAVQTMLSGKPANFTSGEQMYDFVHASDAAHALFCIGESGQKNHTYYIGSTKPDQLKRFIVKIRDAVDPSIPLHLGAVPFNGISLPASVFDCSSLCRDTGYRPRVPFETGIREAVGWLRKQKEEGNF